MLPECCQLILNGGKKNSHLHSFQANVTLQIECSAMEANNRHMSIENFVNIVEARAKF